MNVRAIERQETGTMTISLGESCATSFPPNLAAASAAAYFGTWLYSMESNRTGQFPARLRGWSGCRSEPRTSGTNCSEPGDMSASRHAVSVHKIDRHYRRDRTRRIVARQNHARAQDDPKTW